MDNIIDQSGAAISTTIGERKVDVRRGSTSSAVSQQWFNRPSDERFTSMAELMTALERRTLGTREDVVNGEDIKLFAQKDRPDDLHMIGPDDQPVAPTNIAFQQMCGLVGAPYSYLKELPGFLAAVNLQHGFNSSRDLGQKVWWNEDTREVRAFTGENYGRILDLALAQAVDKIVGDGRTWKVPGQINWQKGTYNPYVDITKDNTTLYASDRDVFMFLVDDTHPIEVGKLDNGDPDLVFRGFYAWNSEVGTRSLGVSTFLLRGVCFNRTLWGVEDLQEMRIRHSRFAPDRFAREAAPMLTRYAQSSPQTIITGIQQAKAAIVASNEDEQKEFLSRRKFSKAAIDNILKTVEMEEGHPATSVWDFVNGITAVARKIPNTDNRIVLERQAGDLMDAVVRNRKVK